MDIRPNAINFKCSKRKWLERPGASDRCVVMATPNKDVNITSSDP